MIKRLVAICAFVFGLTTAMQAQIDARMLRNPDVSETQIVFVYANDLWVVNKEGGTAARLSSPKGLEGFPKFSPDGKEIAFIGNYNGNNDIYTIPAKGGIPTRITSHGYGDRLLDWYPNGDELLFASSRNSERQRYSQFYKISVDGGMAEKLPLAYGEFASLSPNENKIAFTKKSRVFRTWKRYRGGTAADIWIFDLKSFESENITANIANDEIPMWHGDKVYFLSDRGKENRFNIWSYDTKTKATEQLTKFSGYDIHFPSIGPKEIVFEAGGALYLLDLATGKEKEVKVEVVTDHISLTPELKKAAPYFQSAWIAPDGKRVVVEARGELFSVPAEHGPVYDLTNTTGVAERYPAWSPNGKYIAYWSDKSGEYELTIKDMENPTEEKKLTSYGEGYRYRIYWSPDSKKMAFVDQSMKINIYDMDADESYVADQGLYMFEGNLRGFGVSWSSDSRYVTYSRGVDNRNSAIFIYDTKIKKARQVTSGYYSDHNPSFDPEGKYLYLATNRSLSPIYSDLDNTFIYPNTTQLAAISLRKDVPSPLAPRNDVVEIKKEEEKKDDAKKEDDKKEDKDKEELKIDFDGFEERLVILPPKAGNMTNVTAIEGKVLYHRFPNSGAAEKSSPVYIYDLKEREEKTLIDDVNGYMVSADMKKALVFKGETVAVVDIKPGQKMDKPLPLDQMAMEVDPKAEWKQIFTDVWRFERDIFYDKNMHGVDWDEVKDKYSKMLENAVTRADVNYILGEVIGELNASHTYRWGGDQENGKRINTGYLGIDWALEDGAYKIAKIIKGAAWDNEVRSPLDMPGVDVKEGDFILAVNGIKIDVNKEPYAAFAGLAGKTVELTVNSKADFDGAKKVVVNTLEDESRLRHLAWIEKNRKRVEKATNGKIGYVYVRSTGIDGQTELLRQFAAQIDKEGVIIDERFNSGGQLPDRFVEILNRKPLAFWAVRDGRKWKTPSTAVYGPKVMLINGWSGSGGDAFPDYFKKSKLGPLVGTRTWGGLIGITGAPTLIDGGGFTIPTFRMYDPDGKWFLEGHGVDPDIEVDDDPTAMAKGKDPQLEKGIEEVIRLLKKNPPVDPEYPPYEKR